MRRPLPKPLPQQAKQRVKPRAKQKAPALLSPARISPIASPFQKGFTETEVPTGTLPAGSTGAAFTNADNIILVTAKTDTGSPSLDGITEDTVKNQMESLYPGAKISNFATEKKGEGNVFKYKMDATVQGLSISIVQSTYTDAKRTINFSITSNDGSKIDDKIVKVVDDAMASLEIK